MPSAAAIEAIRPPIDLPPANRGRSPASAPARANAARLAASSSGGRSGARRPRSAYTNEKRSVARPSSAAARAKPTRNGASSVPPAPCPSTSTWPASGWSIQAADTLIPSTSTTSRCSGTPPMPWDDASDGRAALRRHVGVRLRRVEARSLLSGGDPKRSDARALLLGAELGRDHLPVPPLPRRVDDGRLAAAGAAGLPDGAAGSDADHAHPAAGRRRRRGGQVPRAGRDPRRQAGAGAVPDAARARV